MFVIRSILTSEYVDENGDLVTDLKDAYYFESKEDAVKYAVHAHLLAPEYVEI